MLTPIAHEAARVGAADAAVPVEHRRAGRLGRLRRALGLKGIIGASILLVVLVATLLANWISPADPAYQQLGFRLRPPFSVGPDGVMHPFGTDHLGRDLLARTLAGARVSLLVAVVGVAAAATIGITRGRGPAYVGGRGDDPLLPRADTQPALPSPPGAITMGAITG